MTPFQNASAWIDAANAQDPNSEIYQSQSYPKELCIRIECIKG
jgi:hypothetical protein